MTIIRKILLLIIFVNLLLIVASYSDQRPPNLEFMQEGFNIYKNSWGKGIYNEALSRNGFVFTFRKDYVQTPHVPFPHPSEITVRGGVKCDFQTDKKNIQSVKSLAETFEIGISTEVSFKGFTGTASREFKNMKEEITKKNKSLAFERSTCTFYDLVLNSNVQVSTAFRNDVNALSQSLNYINFINTYGTHYIKLSQLGVEDTKYYESNSYDVTRNGSNSFQMNNGVGVDVKAVSAKANMNFGWTNTNSNSRVYGGESSTQSSIGTLRGEDMNQWIQQNKDNPNPISFTLGSIIEIVSKVTKNTVTIQGLTNAITNYCTLTRQCSEVKDALPKPVSCRLCKSCGGEYNENKGIHEIDTNWVGWNEMYDDMCSGNLNKREKNQNEGVSLCCQPQSERFTGSCRYCRTCGKQHSVYSGTIKADVSDWRYWISAYENCDGTPQSKGPVSGPINLCCTSDQPCVLCTSCGGDYPNPTGRYSVDKSWKNFFKTRGENCQAGYINRDFNHGVSLCCRNNYANAYKKKLRKP